MRSKAYLLLELLIAFMLVALCALPLVRNPLYSLKTEITAFEKIELERLAEVFFAEIKSELYQNAIPWKALDAAKQPETSFRENAVQIPFSGVTERTYLRKCYLWTKWQKEGKNREDHRIVNVKITFTSVGKSKLLERSFLYQVYLAKFMTQSAERLSSRLKSDTLIYD